MKKLWKKGLCLTLAAVMTLGMGTGAFAKSSTLLSRMQALAMAAYLSR